jgi:hypothetical protein
MEGRSSILSQIQISKEQNIVKKILKNGFDVGKNELEEKGEKLEGKSFLWRGFQSSKEL